MPRGRPRSRPRSCLEAGLDPGLGPTDNSWPRSRPRSCLDLGLDPGLTIPRGVRGLLTGNCLAVRARVLRSAQASPVDPLLRTPLIVAVSHGASASHIGRCWPAPERGSAQLRLTRASAPEPLAHRVALLKNGIRWWSGRHFCGGGGGHRQCAVGEGPARVGPR